MCGDMCPTCSLCLVAARKRAATPAHEGGCVQGLRTGRTTAAATPPHLPQCPTPPGFLRGLSVDRTQGTRVCGALASGEGTQTENEEEHKTRQSRGARAVDVSVRREASQNK